MLESKNCIYSTELLIDSRKIYPGDYNRAEAGTAGRYVLRRGRGRYLRGRELKRDFDPRKRELEWAGPLIQITGSQRPKSNDLTFRVDLV
jgi:hypothetical protein